MPPATPVPVALDPGRVPVHVAWVAGGSGAWARRQDAPPPAVAAAADDAVADLVQGALAVGVRWLTVYVPPGSTEDGGDGGAGEALGAWPERHGGWAADLAVEVRVLGPHGVMALSPTVVSAHRRPTPPDRPALVLTLAVGYSGRGEIVDAVRRLAADGVAVDDVDETAIAGRLFAPDMPDPDLVVRAGGDRRISDLLLWEVAYSELVFIDDPWPAIGRGHFYDAVVEFQRRDRRYGGLIASGDRR